MKLNIGSGYTKIDGYLNVDDDDLVKPDYVVDFEKGILPFGDNSVDAIIAHHILEHIGDNFILLMQEIYRVCKNGAIIDILVPHHNHDVFHNDPTHKRKITVDGMRLFSKKFIDEHNSALGASSGMAYKYAVDFEMVWFQYEYDVFYKDDMANFHKAREDGTLTQAQEFEYIRLFREANNVAIETMMKLVVVK